MLYEDDMVKVIKDVHPQAPVHWLVISKVHVPELTEASDELAGHMIRVAKKVAKDENLKGYRIVNNGRGAAIIDHIHFHVLGSVDKFRKL